MSTNLLTTVSIFLFLLRVGSAAAQRPDSVIALKSRVIAERPGLEPALQTNMRAAGARAMHVIIQFRRTPTVEEQAALTRLYGIRLLDPLPAPAFFAVLPRDTAYAQRLVIDPAWQVRWVGAIRPEDKTAPWLLRDSVPAHARLAGGRAGLVVQFFEDISVDEQRIVLDRHGARIVERIAPLNGWEITLQTSEIRDLATEDATQWIVPIPGPPEVDNDGVRSASGVNADAVMTPTPYNLSGSGVTIALFDWQAASLTHLDFAGRITLGDATIPARARTHAHNESVLVNGFFDLGEAVYCDMDDSGNVTVGDIRLTGVGVFAANSVVATAAADIGTPLVLFHTEDTTANIRAEMFVDVNADLAYTAGEAIYRDKDVDGRVNSVADELLTMTAATNGTQLVPFPTNPHAHPTKVAGTIMGSGALSVAHGGSAGQWKGVAPGAQLVTYDIYGSLWSEYPAAQAKGSALTANPWGERLSHCHQKFPPITCYNTYSELYDAAVSGGTKANLPSGMAMVVVGSAGNQGRPEVHSENIAVNGRFDDGESIYIDRDNNRLVSSADTLLNGSAQADGASLIYFGMDEMHTEAVSDSGAFEVGEGIYVDVDRSRTVSAGDVRVSVPSWPTGSTVALNDADETAKTPLRQFRLWGNIRIANAAKNTIQVGAISSDAIYLPSWTSRGPTDDGRLKPDLVAAGSQNGGEGGITSTFPGNGYAIDRGTSMSTGAAAGSVALLTQWYREACQPAATPAALKALLIHAAEDVVTTTFGALPGPDFASGFGRLRVKESVDLVPNHLQGTIAPGAVATPLTITLGAVKSLKVTLVWSDLPWTPNAPPDPVRGTLVRDLDLVVIAPDGKQYTPWLLDPTNPFLPASRQVVAAGMPIPEGARDRRNPVEQVVIDDASPGTWQIRVSARTTNLAPQNYVLASEIIAPQASPCSTTPPADIWIRDNPSDTGVVPSAGAMWLGPDLWNRTASDNLTAHQNPEHGQANYLYANIRNATSVAVKATTIELWVAAASIGLIWPDNFTYVGRIFVPNLGANEVRQVGPLQWYPPSPILSGHFCVYMRVMSPQDPITQVETSSIWNNAQNSNNIAYRNLNVVDLLPNAAVTFLVRNTARVPASIDIRLRIPAEFLAAGEVTLALSPELARRWPITQRVQLGTMIARRDSTRVAGPPGVAGGIEGPELTYRVRASDVVLRGFALGPQQAERATLIFSSSQRIEVTYEIDVIEIIDGREVGGIRYIVRTGGAR